MGIPPNRSTRPEARQVIINECGACRFFVTIPGVREKRLGCVVGKKKTPNPISQGTGRDPRVGADEVGGPGWPGS